MVQVIILIVFKIRILCQILHFPMIKKQNILCFSVSMLTKKETILFAWIFKWTLTVKKNVYITLEMGLMTVAEVIFNYSSKKHPLGLPLLYKHY